MSFGMEAGIFLAYAMGILGVYFFGKMLLMPLGKIMKLLFSSILGGVVLVIINAIGTAVDIVVPVNILTSVIAGALGLPGVVGLLIYFNFIG